MLRITFLLAVCSIAVEAKDAYCQGFDAGFEAGFCYGNYSCLSPIPPICPIPGLSETGYQGGYNRGFVAGQSQSSRKGTSGIRGNQTGGGIVNPIRFQPDMGVSDAIETGQRIKAEEQRRTIEKENHEAAQAAVATNQILLEADLKARAIAFSEAYPDQPNPYQEALTSRANARTVARPQAAPEYYASPDAATESQIREERERAVFVKWLLVGIGCLGLLAILASN